MTVSHAYPVTTNRLYRSATQICRYEVSKLWYLVLLRSRITFSLQLFESYALTQTLIAISTRNTANAF